MSNNIQYDLILSGAHVVAERDNKDSSLGDQSLVCEIMDIGITGDTIAALGSLDKQKAKTVVKLNGLTVLPGLIDTQVHFREPGLTHKEDLASGTRGALKGGITAIFDMPNTNPSTTSALSLADKLSRAKERAWTDYAFFIGASAENATHLDELQQLPGCCGVKIFMGSSTGSLLVSEEKALEEVVKHLLRRCSVHCEQESRLRERRPLVENHIGEVHLHPFWRDEITAFNATKQMVELAEKFDKKVHILHVTTAEEMQYLATKKHVASVEVTPQHLTLYAEECYERLGTLAQMNPPIRSKQHQDALWKAIDNGTVDIIGSDHAPHTLEEKNIPFPNSPSGMPGVQTTVPVMLNHVNQGRLSLTRLIELMHYNPCRLFAMPDRMGIAVGKRANFTIVDMNKENTITSDWIESKVAWTPFEGMKVKGWPIATMLHGKMAYRDGEFLAKPSGRPIAFHL